MKFSILQKTLSVIPSIYTIVSSSVKLMFTSAEKEMVVQPVITSSKKDAGKHPAAFKSMRNTETSPKP